MQLSVANRLLISGSQVLVAIPFSLLGLTKFEHTEEKAFWQPPNKVFGIVWPCLYSMLYIMNYKILSNPLLTLSYKALFAKNVIIESFCQSVWLYYFRYKKQIRGRSKEQYFSSLLAIIVLLFQSSEIIRMLFSCEKIGNIKYLYVPYFLWLNFASLLNIQLVAGYTKQLKHVGPKDRFMII